MPIATHGGRINRIDKCRRAHLLHARNNRYAQHFRSGDALDASLDEIYGAIGWSHELQQFNVLCSIGIEKKFIKSFRRRHIGCKAHQADDIIFLRFRYPAIALARKGADDILRIDFSKPVIGNRIRILPVRCVIKAHA